MHWGAHREIVGDETLALRFGVKSSVAPILLSHRLWENKYNLIFCLGRRRFRSAASATDIIHILRPVNNFSF
jgi:hypothetical protein